MADPLGHLIDGIRILSLVAETAGIKPIEIRLADERDGRALINLLNAQDSARLFLTSPIDEKGHEFQIEGVKVTWPQ